MPVPVRHDNEVLSHQIFSALMWALTYPASKQTSIGASLVLIGRALLDLETSFFCPDDRIAKILRLTGAKEKPLAQADYIFMPEMNMQILCSLGQAKQGTLLNPDDSATVVAMCTFDTGVQVGVTGAGVAQKNYVQSTIPIDFWELRNEACSYPLGWDIFLCDGNDIVGVPRSSTLEFVGYN